MSQLKLLMPKIRKNNDRSWVSLYTCVCGNTVEAVDSRVRNGYKKSCGCLQKIKSSMSATKLFTTHGKSKTKEYRVWGDMIARCTIPSQTNCKYYGGRGIKVCERWLKFENFLDDMGHWQQDTSIDRINNNGNYEPSNCRWATKSEQMKNRRPRHEWKKP